jgi:hypothetical protein
MDKNQISYPSVEYNASKGNGVACYSKRYGHALDCGPFYLYSPSGRGDMCASEAIISTNIFKLNPTVDDLNYMIASVNAFIGVPTI